MTPTTELRDRARFLRNAAPQPYSDFVLAFATYTGETVQNLLDATINLPVAQGQAQQCANILKILEAAKNGK